MLESTKLSVRLLACRSVLAVVLIAFAAAGIARLNPFCLFEPDTADYLFTARSVAQLEGVREIDHPARPLHVFRPPGLPLLLAPLARLRPYDVEAAKLVVLAATLLALWLLARYARSVGTGDWGAVVVVILVAASPYALLHATEVVTEPAFLAAALGGLLLVSARPVNPTRAVVGFAAFLFASAALFRTVGLALIVALALWALWRRQRSWLVAAVAASVPTLVWMWRCSRTGAPTYLGAVADAVERLGAGGYGSAVLRQGGWYLARMPALIVPGMSATKPVYERVLLYAAPGPRMALWIPAVLAVVVAIAAAYGMWIARGQGGSMAALFVVTYLAALAVYPPKHERLAWPLVPFFWTWAAVAAFRWAPWRGLHRPGAGRRNTIALASATVLIVLLEVAGSSALVQANQTWRADHESFYLRRMPPTYYVDWQSAGRAIRDQSPPHARVLTRHSDIGFAARRFQDSIRFEETAPSQWRGAIAALPARYLALPDVRCGEGLRWQMFDSDPAYRYTPRYNDNGALVFEVEPNRDGTVELESAQLQRELSACRAIVEKLPQRTDLKRRLAELLGEAGNAAEGLAVVDPLTEQRGVGAEVWLTRGQLLLDLDRPEEAVQAFDRAAQAVGAEWLDKSLARGRRNAADMLAMRRLPAEEQAQRLVQEGMARLDALDIRAAAERIARAERLTPEAPEILAARATLARRVGRRSESREIFAHLAARGDRAATAMVSELDREAGVESAMVNATANDCLRVARFQTGDGIPGRALATLERAARQFPNDLAVLSSLADLYLFFGLAERAEPIFRALTAADAGNAVAARGLAHCRELLQPADY